MREISVRGKQRRHDVGPLRTSPPGGLVGVVERKPAIGVAYFCTLRMRGKQRHHDFGRGLTA